MPPEIYEQPKTVEHHVIENDPNFYEVERIEFDHGIRVYVKGHEFPHLGMPTPQSLWAINIVKSLLKNGILLFILNRTAWKNIAWRALEQHILKFEFLTPTAQGVYMFIHDLTDDEQLAKIIAHVIEYDGAYRYRLMDLASETDYLSLSRAPITELNRLLKLNRARDYQEVSDKLSKLSKLSYALFWPPFRRKFRKALIQTNLGLLAYTPEDRYWARLKIDYHYNV